MRGPALIGFFGYYAAPITAALEITIPNNRPILTCPTWPALVMGGWVCSGAVGCVQVYQPMSGFHRPVVIDTKALNFQGIRLTVRCFPGELLNAQESSVLCNRVQTLFENQGATVKTRLSSRDLPEDALEGPAENDLDDPSAPKETTDLVLELRSRKIAEETNPILSAFSALTFTIVPIITESVFAQDITVRDGNGFLLVRDTLQGRIVRRIGAGPWIGNKVLNLSREKPDRIKRETINQDISQDLYRQLSQLVFNAKMQWEVLQEIAPSDAPESSWR